MKTKQLLGLIGSLILFVGVFTPIVSIPIMGNMNYFQNGRGDGVIVLILAVVSLVLVLAKKYKGLWFTGLASIAALAFTFINFQMKFLDIKSHMDGELAGNPFRGLADMAMQSVQLQWGWALLIVGAALVIAAAAIKEDSQEVIPDGGGNKLTRIKIISICVAIVLAVFVIVPLVRHLNSTQTVGGLSPLQFPPQQKYNHNYKITTKYDKMEDYTEVKLDDLGLKTAPPLQIYFIYHGKNFKTPENVTLYFHTYSHDWQYLTNHSAILLINDMERIDLGNADCKNDVYQGYTLENMFFHIPIRTFLTIANAKSVEGRLGSDNFKIEGEELEAIRDFASRMKSQ